MARKPDPNPSHQPPGSLPGEADPDPASPSSQPAAPAFRASPSPASGSGDQQHGAEMSTHQSSGSGPARSLRSPKYARLITGVLAVVYLAWLVYLAWVSYMVISG